MTYKCISIPYYLFGPAEHNCHQDVFPADWTLMSPAASAQVEGIPWCYGFPNTPPIIAVHWGVIWHPSCKEHAAKLVCRSGPDQTEDLAVVEAIVTGGPNCTGAWLDCDRLNKIRLSGAPVSDFWHAFKGDGVSPLKVFKSRLMVTYNLA